MTSLVVVMIFLVLVPVHAGFMIAQRTMMALRAHNLHKQHQITPYMGCTESVPVANSFEKVHKVDHRSLGKPFGAGPSIEGPVTLVVREKLFSWSGDSFSVKTPTGAPFGNNIQVKGKAWSFRDQMALLDGDGKPIAVCLRKFQFGFTETFKIYTTTPLYPGQKPSERTYNSTVPLYTYCQVERVPLSTTQQVTFANETSPSYTIHRVGSWWPKKRVVKYHGQPAAIMEGGTWDTNWNSYLITVNPGIDPCLIVCLCAICDEMDEENRNSSDW